MRVQEHDDKFGETDTVTDFLAKRPPKELRTLKYHMHAYTRIGKVLVVEGPPVYHIAL